MTGSLTSFFAAHCTPNPSGFLSHPPSLLSILLLFLSFLFFFNFLFLFFFEVAPPFVCRTSFYSCPNSYLFVTIFELRPRRVAVGLVPQGSLSLAAREGPFCFQLRRGLPHLNTNYGFATFGRIPLCGCSERTQLAEISCVRTGGIRVGQIGLRQAFY